MHSLDEELTQLQTAGVLDDATAVRLITLERATNLSLFSELRIGLYAAVAMVIAGVGVLISENLERIGPVVLVIAIAAAAAGCYVPAVLRKRRGLERSAAGDYLLLLGALLVSADLGYAESQFHWFGEGWSLHLLVLAVFHAATAYALDSRLVLAVALTAFAGWFGIERGPASFAPWQFATPALGLRALLCAATLLAWREIDRRKNLARFGDVFEHFAANLAFWGVLGWCSDSRLWVVGVPALLLLGIVAIRAALASAAEMFAVYGVGYTALGLSLAIAQLTGATLLSATLVLVVVLTAATVLRRLHDRLKGARP